MWMISDDTEGEATTNKKHIKQEVDISQSISKKPDNYADVLVDVIDMTMDTTRVPIKPKRFKAAYEAWKPPQCIWDQNKAT
jgi:hypothetical protein